MPWAHAFLPQTLPHFLIVVFYAPLSLPLTQSLYPEQSSQNRPSPNTHPQLTSGFRTAAGDQGATGDANKNRVWTGWTSLPTVSQGLAQTVRPALQNSQARWALCAHSHGRGSEGSGAPSSFSRAPC